MRSTLARVLFAVSVTMLLAPAAFATYYWIGFGGVQKKPAVVNGVSGTLYYMDAVVGSDETTQNATYHNFVLYMQGAGPAGGCPSPLFNEVTTKVHPAVALTRFQIFYPARKLGPGGILPSPLVEVNYSFKAYTTGDFQVHHEFSPVKFPSGGTISCVRLTP
jgi:hypothetical protein